MMAQVGGADESDDGELRGLLLSVVRNGGRASTAEAERKLVLCC